MIDDPDHFDIVTFKRKSIPASWEFMFTCSAYETGDMIAQHEILEEVSALIDQDVLRTTMMHRASRSMPRI
ncbi:hypothetical protein [Sphingomonas sp.]|uniref:hypothetical protein n=1 Tax=Sphingomonas sp. TaxID=28214 RepID=UPI003D6CB9ED